VIYLVAFKEYHYRTGKTEGRSIFLAGKSVSVTPLIPNFLEIGFNPQLLIANTGKASNCETERRKTKRKGIWSQPLMVFLFQRPQKTRLDFLFLFLP
jgi:hypothetical protein